MTDNKQDPKDFEAVDFEHKPTLEEQKEARLARLLASVEQGWKISILRSQPSWCRGHLETIEIYDPSEPVDVDYLIRTWGGQRLHLKVHNERGDWVGGGSISLFSYPPKVQGTEIKQTDIMGHYPAQQQMPINPVQYAPQAGGQQTIDLTKLFQMLQHGKKNELDLALKILERQPQTVSTPTQAPGIGSMFEQMTAMLGLFAQMREMFGDSGGGGGSSGSSGDDLTPVIGDVIKGLFDRQNTQQAGKPALVAPNPGAGTGIPPGRPMGPVQEPGHTIPDLHPVEGLSDENLSQIANKLSNLSPGDAVDVVMQALGDMPESKRAEMMQTFFGELTQDSDLDGMLNSGDTYSQDNENEDDQPEDHQTPNKRRTV